MMIFETHFDRVARRYTLNKAILVLVFWPAYFAIGALTFFWYFRQHDPYYLYAGPINIVLSLLGTLHAVGVLHAVVRRLLRQAPQPMEDTVSCRS
jgi:hypothetical protein